jgi:hypothetical protein
MKPVLVLYNHITNTPQSYQDRVRDITNFFNDPLLKDYHKVETSTLTATLADLADNGYDWTIVNSLGHCAKVSADPFNTALAECQDNDWNLRCHVIQRSFGYPHFADNQFFVINLQVWRELGEPSFEVVRKPEVFDSVGILRSPDTYHDDYAHYVAPLSGPVKYLINERSFGSLVVQKFLEAGYTIPSFDHKIQYSKFSLWAEQEENQTLLEEVFATGQVNNQLPLPQIIKEAAVESDTLLNTVYVLNTEEVYPTPMRMLHPIDHYVGVASGFKSLLLLHKFNFTPETKVTYVDFSQPALDFQKYLIENWNGNLMHYDIIVNNFKKMYPDNRYVWRDWNSWVEEIHTFLQQANLTSIEFVTLWQHYQKLSHNFINLNLLEESGQAQLVDLAQSGPGPYVYIWLSNSFDMLYTRVFYSKSYTDASFKRLKDLLRTTENRYIVESNGIFYRIG